jgi:hypothetical protein
MLPILPLTEKSTQERPRAGVGIADKGIVLYSGKKRERHVYGINIMDLSLVQHIPQETSMSGRDMLILIYSSYLYILRLTNTRSMRRLTSVPRNVVTETKENVFGSFDIISYKIATLRCLCKGLSPDDAHEVEEEFQKCGLRKVDATLYFMLHLNDDAIDLVKSLKTVEDKSFVLSNNTIPEEIDDYVLKELRKAANYNAYGIRFIAHANRMQIEDLTLDLMSRAIQAYYWVRPFYSKEHAVNYGKRACHGYAQNLREFYQSPDRARAINTGEGYDNTIRDIDDNMHMYDSYTEEENRIIDYLDYKLAAYR